MVDEEKMCVFEGTYERGKRFSYRILVGERYMDIKEKTTKKTY